MQLRLQFSFILFQPKLKLCQPNLTKAKVKLQAQLHKEKLWIQFTK